MSYRQSDASDWPPSPTSLSSPAIPDVAVVDLQGLSDGLEHEQATHEAQKLEKQSWIRERSELTAAMERAVRHAEEQSHKALEAGMALQRSIEELEALRLEKEFCMQQIERMEAQFGLFQDKLHAYEKEHKALRRANAELEKAQQEKEQSLQEKENPRVRLNATEHADVILESVPPVESEVEQQLQMEWQQERLKLQAAVVDLQGRLHGLEHEQATHEAQKLEKQSWIRERSELTAAMERAVRHAEEQSHKALEAGMALQRSIEELEALRLEKEFCMQQIARMEAQFGLFQDKLHAYEKEHKALRQDSADRVVDEQEKQQCAIDLQKLEQVHGPSWHWDTIQRLHDVSDFPAKYLQIVLGMGRGPPEGMKRKQGTGQADAAPGRIGSSESFSLSGSLPDSDSLRYSDSLYNSDSSLYNDSLPDDQLLQAPARPKSDMERGLSEVEVEVVRLSSLLSAAEQEKKVWEQERTELQRELGFMRTHLHLLENECAALRGRTETEAAPSQEKQDKLSGLEAMLANAEDRCKALERRVIAAESEMEAAAAALPGGSAKESMEEEVKRLVGRMAKAEERALALESRVIATETEREAGSPGSTMRSPTAEEQSELRSHNASLLQQVHALSMDNSKLLLEAESQIGQFQKLQQSYEEVEAQCARLSEEGSRLRAEKEQLMDRLQQMLSGDAARSVEAEQEAPQPPESADMQLVADRLLQFFHENAGDLDLQLQAKEAELRDLRAKMIDAIEVVSIEHYEGLLREGERKLAQSGQKLAQERLRRRDIEKAYNDLYNLYQQCKPRTRPCGEGPLPPASSPIRVRYSSPGARTRSPGPGTRVRSPSPSPSPKVQHRQPSPSRLHHLYTVS